MAKLVVFFVLVLSIKPAFAVDPGFLIGAGQSKLDGGDALLIREGFGLRVGVPLKFQMSEVFDLRSGFFYATREYNFTSIWTDPLTFETEQDSISVQLGYIDIPIVAQLNLSHWFAIFAGPVYSVNISEDVEADSSGDGVVEDEKGSMFSAQAGLALTFGSVGVDLVYEKGLTDAFGDAEGKWSYVGLNLIYWFNATGDSYDYGSSYRYR